MAGRNIQGGVNLGAAQALTSHGEGILGLYKIWDNRVKPISWIDDSLERLREFPPDAMDDAGHQLDQVQRGNEPKSWKPMPSIGLGVNEIRVHAGGAFRVIYVAKFAEAVYVIHVFQKKTRKTSQGDIELSRQRYRAMLTKRRQA